MIKSRTQKAVDWMGKNLLATQVEAAGKFGISPSAVSRELRRRKNTTTCPTCGKSIKTTTLEGTLPC